MDTHTTKTNFWTKKDRIKNLIEDHDMFGHEVNLNFNKAGYTHNTLIGGLFSVLIKIFMIGYIAILVKRMTLSEANDHSCEDYLIDLTD